MGKKERNVTYCPYLSSAFFSSNGIPDRKSKIAIVNTGLSTAAHWPPVAVLALMLKTPHQIRISPK